MDAQATDADMFDINDWVNLDPEEPGSTVTVETEAPSTERKSQKDTRNFQRSALTLNAGVTKPRSHNPTSSRLSVDKLDAAARALLDSDPDTSTQGGSSDLSPQRNAAQYEQLPSPFFGYIAEEELSSQADATENYSINTACVPHTLTLRPCIKKWPASTSRTDMQSCSRWDCLINALVRNATGTGPREMQMISSMLSTATLAPRNGDATHRRAMPIFNSLIDKKMVEEASAVFLAHLKAVRKRQPTGSEMSFEDMAGATIDELESCETGAPGTVDGKLSKRWLALKQTEGMLTSYDVFAKEQGDALDAVQRKSVRSSAPVSSHASRRPA